MTPIQTTVSFDMRAPAFGTPTQQLYAAALEMAAYADTIGVDRIGLMEHHGSDDGYLPQPFVLAAGMAAVTKQVRFLLGAVILPLHDPVIVAEQIAILDLMSNGRLNVIFGAGYVRSEFAIFEVSLSDRARLLDEKIDIILRALSGEVFEADGRPISVRPLPVQKPENIIYVGGGVPVSAKRAARFGVGLGPMSAALIPIYEEECRKLGREPGDYFRPCHRLPGIIMLSEDPERTWALLEPHAFHVVSEYAKWAAQEPNSNSPFKGLTTLDALRASGMFAVWTPDELVANADKVEDRGTFVFQPLVGGFPPEEGWKSLELLKDAIPRLKAVPALTTGETDVRSPSEPMTSAHDAIVTITGLEKTYKGGHRALKSVDLAIRRGEIFALLGPNGAGKTTLIGIVCGLVRPSGGTVIADGHDIARDYRAARAKIGLVPQELSTDMFETVWHSVNYSRGLFGKPRDHAYVERVLRDLSLWDKRGSKIGALSGGMKRRVLIAKALSHEPTILFLDEPTAGVDVELRRDMWEMVRKLREQGVTIILTTHYIEEAEEMANRIGVIDGGKIILIEEKHALMTKLGRTRVTVGLTAPLAAIPAGLAEEHLALSEDGASLVLTVAGADDGAKAAAELVKRVTAAGIDFASIDTVRSTLEDIFVDLVEKRA